MNGMDKADARARLNAPADGWALGIRWPMQNRQI
jgi:hypothetical protein